jgi:hypothetical protein
MVLNKIWAGRIFGTNIGNVSVRLEGDDQNLTGTLRFADSEHGITVYDITGTFDGHALTATGTPRTVPDGFEASNLTAKGVLKDTGRLDGEWETTLGTGGNFVLYPHDGTEARASDLAPPEADQLHTKRHTLGAIEIDKEGLIRIAEIMQAEFPDRKVVVTLTADTEQSRFLGDFKTLNHANWRAQEAKLFVQAPELGGVSRTLTIEFGPTANFAMAQSTNEPWTLGIIERMRREIRPFERTLAINIKRIGLGINQALLLWALIFLPEIHDIWTRLAFLLTIVGIAWINTKIHERYIPLATIKMGPQPQSILYKLGPSVSSWGAALISGVAVSLLSAWAKGWLQLP